MRRCFLLLFFLGIFFFDGNSQNESFRFNRLSDNTNLSQSWVRCFYQDDTGFIWVGTSNGLNRFDGLEFKKLFGNSDNEINFGNTAVNSLIKKNTNEFWIATDVGAYYYNYIEETLHSYSEAGQLPVLVIFEDSAHNTWFGSSAGLYKKNPTQNKIIKYTHQLGNPSGISSNYINTLFEDSNHHIWIGTKQGLLLYNKTSDSFKRYLLPGEKDDSSSRDILTICEDKNQRMWFGTAQNGIFVAENSIVDAINPSYRKIADGQVVDLLIDRRNNLWIGHGSGEGLEIISLDNISTTDDFKTTHLKKIPDDPTSLSDNSIYTIFEDKTGDIWIGTFGSVINYYSARSKQFRVVEESFSQNQSIRNNLVNVFLEEEEYLWIGTEGGLDRYNKITGQYSHFEYDSNNPKSLAANPIFALLKDSRGNLWVGTWAGGLNLFDYQTETFKRFLPDGTPGALSNANVFSIFEDSRQNLWIGTIGGGLNLYNYTTGLFSHYMHDPNDPQSINANEIDHIHESSDGKLYISAYRALEEFDYQNNNFKHIFQYNSGESKNKNTSIISSFEDSNNNIWIATNNGLDVIDNSNRLKAHYSTKDGLPDNTIQAILEDNIGNLWIGTNKGLSRFIDGIYLPADPVFNNFLIYDGLSGNEFKKRSAYKNKDGLFYFGTSKGYTQFYPNSINFNSIKPPVVITDVLVLEKSDKKKGRKQYKQIDGNLNHIAEIELPYHNSDFIINYAALNYLNPKKNQYQFKLDGYDNDWKLVENQQSATYTNISPGEYTFMVQGTNNDGVWSSSIKSLKIIIHPPWWDTIIFKLILILIVILSVYFIFRFRLAIVKKQKVLLQLKVDERTCELSEKNILLKNNQEKIATQNKELSNHRNHLEQLVKNRTAELEKAKLKAEDSDRLKSAFLANMSHEIRTPLNAIVGFSSLLKEKSITEEDQDMYINIIDNNSESLMVLINDILDISLIDANQLKLNSGLFNAHSILSEIESTFKLKNTKQLEIKFVNNNETKGLFLYNDSVRFSQVINNLISNAYKYTDQGSIRFGYKIINNKVRFFVSDSGIGIEKEDQQNIFNHFYKIETENNKLYRGVGIGLSITKKLVEMMGGKIQLESEINVGSTFFFDLVFKEIPDKINSKKEPKSHLNHNFEGLTVLVAEDEPTNYKLLEKILQMTGAKVVWAQNGQEAVDYILNYPDSTDIIVLMDIKMPVLNGYQANRIIKETNPTIPVIALTAYANAEDKQTIKEENFDDYIVKPLNAVNLLKSIEQLRKKRP